MKILLLIIPIFLTSCGAFVSGFSVMSMMSGHAANVMPKEREAIIHEAAELTLEKIKEEDRGK